ncbi:MAG: hypothetical protein ACFB03_17740 [Paracoccaceae bacterium]
MTQTREKPAPVSSTSDAFAGTDRETAPRRQPGVRFDWRDWAPYLEDDAIPDDQKRELIETLWSIVTAFVDMGWSLNPTQQICGQYIDLKAVLDAAVLESEQEKQEQEDA